MLGGVLAHILSDLDEFRQPANLALRVTLNVIYPSAPAQSRVHGTSAFAKASAGQESAGPHFFEFFGCSSRMNDQETSAVWPLS